MGKMGLHEVSLAIGGKDKRRGPDWKLTLD